MPSWGPACSSAQKNERPGAGRMCCRRPGRSQGQLVFGRKLAQVDCAIMAAYFAGLEIKQKIVEQVTVQTALELDFDIVDGKHAYDIDLTRHLFILPLFCGVEILVVEH